MPLFQLFASRCNLARSQTKTVTVLNSPVVGGKGNRLVKMVGRLPVLIGWRKKDRRRSADLRASLFRPIRFHRPADRGHWFFVIAATVIGGASLPGGMIGALVITILKSGGVKIGWPQYVHEAVMGTVIIGAMTMDIPRNPEPS